MSALLEFVASLPPLVLLLGAALVVGIALLALSNAFGAKTALPSAARILASDTGQNRVKRYESKRLKLRGQPDFIIEERSGPFGRKRMVPVEAKSWASPVLYPSQAIQAAAYIALMKEEHGDRAVADYAYVVYKANAKRFRVDWTPQIQQDLLRTMEEVRELKRRVAAEI
jgi:CRISPR/Cas system-associated exonuclease Cas4 (RecB family)